MSPIQAIFMLVTLESLYSRMESTLQYIMILKKLDFDISTKVGAF